MFFVVSVTTFAQDCNCESNFEWLKITFEENDAGAQYAINKKGQASYNIHNQLIAEKVKSATDIYDCTNILNEWLRFFRSGHLGIEFLPEAIKETSTKDKLFYEWETLTIDTVEFKKYLDNKPDSDFEGIWDDGIYKIGVRKINNQYIGFIISSDYEDWTEGQVKFKISADSVTYYMRNRSMVNGKPTLRNSNMLCFDEIGVVFIRIYPINEDKSLQSLIVNKHYLEKLNNNTFYFRIPSFIPEYKSLIDSIINANFDEIINTENLIIDLRNNGGGLDNSWTNLLPILYTNPVRTRAAEFLSTELNNQMMLNLSKNSLDKEWAEQSYNRLKNRIGEFVNIFDFDVHSGTMDTIYIFPKNVGIIVNSSCGSATEQFLLAAKQSKKVKIFGTKTFGALDFSNVNIIKSPCNEFQLYYALSKTIGFENFPIDDIGIQPDFYLDNKIPEYKWIEYVNKILNNE